MTDKSQVFEGGPTTSQHVMADDDDHFEKSSFKLKRTRSLGLLDEFIPGMTEGKANDDDNGDDDNNANNVIDLPQNEDTPSYSSSDSVDDTAGAIDMDVDNDNIDVNQENQPLATSQDKDKPFLESVIPHDDADIATEPSRHVDYLAYQWDVSDIAKSWRYVIQKRKDVANSARLENASWRTWAQRRSNLKTISPEVVNWSKDSDVTWLYGPILKDDSTLRNEEELSQQTSDTATFAVAGDISIPSRAAPKPILKRRTVEQSMISHSNLLKLQLASNKVYQKQRDSYLKQQSHAALAPKDHDFNDYDAILAKLNKQYQNVTQTTNSSVTKLQELLNKKKNPSEEPQFNQFFHKESSPLPPKSSMKTFASPLREEVVISPPPQPKPIRHIHFNEEVQQCIAVDYIEDDFELDSDDFDRDDDYSGMGQSVYENIDGQFGDNMDLGKSVDPYNIDEQDDDYDDDEDEDEDDDDDDDDEGGFFLKVKSAAPPNLTIAHSKEPTEDTDSISTSNSKVYRTIQLLPSTSINYASSEEESDDENPYTSSMSHNAENKGYDFYYDYNSVYTCDDGSHTKKADVVDIPDNITLGSNIDYEMLDVNSSIHSQSPKVSPIIHPTQPIPTQPKKAGTFNLQDDSDSDSDSDEGFSISASSSSKDLAQSVFGMSSSTHFPNGYEQEPVNAPTSLINPNKSNSNLVKQPHSSSSLSDQFFGSNASTGITNVNDSETLTKQPHSNASLSDQFFGSNASTGITNVNDSETLTKQPHSNASLSDQFFGITKLKSSSADLASQFFGTNEDNIAADNTPSPSNSFSTQRKSTPLPPHTTSANAFLGTTPPKTKNTFLFDDDSDSEEEEIQIKSPTPRSSTGNTPSYNRLSQVADKSGLKSPSPEPNSVVQQTKDLANHFLGRK